MRRLPPLLRYMFGGSLTIVREIVPLKKRMIKSKSLYFIYVLIIKPTIR